MNRLLVASVFIDHPRSSKWYELQLRFLRETTPDFVHAVFLNGSDKFYYESIMIGTETDVYDPNDELRWQKSHLRGLQKIMEYFRQRKNDFESFLILDSDCFPIKAGWLDRLLGAMGSFTAAGAVRYENLDKFVHPSIVFFKPEALGTNFAIRPMTNQLGNTFKEPTANLSTFYPLIRTNKVNYHPLMAGIYWDSFYHQGAGSRECILRLGDADYYPTMGDGNTESVRLYNQLIYDPKSFVAALATTPKLPTTSDEFNYILSLPNWPEAVNPAQISGDSPTEQIERMETILAMFIPEDLHGKKFLDFGCGDGYSVDAAEKAGADAYGYDVVPQGEKDWSGEKLTTDWNIISKNKYDVIMLYDVLDHATDPIDILNKCKDALTPTGRIYCRCHPISARHAGHLYKHTNKAFLHLVFNEGERRAMGFPEVPTIQQALYPIVFYKNLFEQTGLDVLTENVERHPVEPFFSETPVIKKRIMSCWGRQPATDIFPEFQLSQCFLDWTLCSK